MKRSLTKFSVLTFLCLLFFNSTFAQNITVQGTVTDAADKSAMPSVSVLIKGATTGTQTDANGKYSISVPANSILVFSYVGYTRREIPVSNQTTINVSMSSASQDLQQVVVVGYGTQKRRDVTGAISSVKGDDIARMPATNPVSSLQGKVAGLTVVNSGTPGASPTVRIRGINSTNSANPLYVVDGILSDNIDFLNPGDIESIDLLRDPSSIAIYGLRGANGVIAVTTKRAARGKTSINFQTMFGIQHVTNKIDVTDATGFKKLYSAQLSNLSAAPFDFTNYTGNTDWQDQILRNANINTNTLSISNTGEKSSTLLSIGYNNQDGVVKYDNYKKYIVRLTEEISLNNNIKVGGNITGFRFTSQPSPVSLNSAIWASPIVPIQVNDNTYYSMPSFQRAQVGNPVAALNNRSNVSVNGGYRAVGSIFAEVKFLKDFTFRSTGYIDLGFNNNRSYTPLPFRFVNIGENGAANTTTFDQTARTSVRQEQAEYRSFQQDHTLSYDKTLEGGHKISAIVGFTSIYSASTTQSGSRSDSTVNIPNSPDFWYINVANASNPGNFGGAGSESSSVGAFARVNYSYKDKYLLNATIRRDGSSKFAPQNRWGTFGSVGLGWVVSDEDFFKSIKGIDFLKLRAAWGKLGNANGLADNLYRPGISNAGTAVFGNNVYSSIQAAYIPDPNLHWEVVNGTDLGLDMRALDNRVTAQLNFYNRTTTDILTSLPIPNDSRSYFTNLGKITNKGIEVSLGWNDKIGSDFTYSISPNFSYNKNVVNSIGDNINFQILGNGGVNKTETGNSIGYFYGYKQTGIYQSTADLGKMPRMSNSLPGDIAYEDVNGDGVISPADRTYLGTPFPPYSYGLNVTMGYKGFDMQLEGQGVSGNKIYTQRRTSTFAVLNYESNRLNAWTGGGTSNVEPILDNSRGNNYLFSTYYLEPGDYFRIRTAQLGYTFGPSLFGKTGIQKLRIYVSGQNLKTWTKATGYTPEAQIGNILGGGADNGVYPVPAVYSVGLNVTF
ncbi:SusC/RagA family TonB-linked outer membrane protein [Pedobacter duraquae]|uniref:TonB-linked SusC/RagA family outer membrane protein n=1 Tax=Pedobacter duraquae TaxID=425511 RepID=A0A4R6IBX3_9SPHI|nr:TonB-dependent receptor [Pedobacter duraquae]TDO19720.1 TonB-linked SusC/RagA family outer membrane protein [Pedobacter duraquae]